MKIRHHYIKNTAIGLVALAIMLLFSFVGQNSVNATSAGCDGSQEKYYNCLLSWSDLDKEVNNWCMYAKAGKDSSGDTYRNLCIFTLTGLTGRDEPAVGNFQKEGGRVNDPKCYTQAQGYDRNSLCWGYIKTTTSAGSAWKSSIAKLVADCGLPPSQDAKCAEQIRKTFLHSQGWADDPGKAQEPTETTVEGASGTASDTPFVKRIAAYLQWAFVGIGVLAAFGFVISAIQYIAAQDNPQSVAAAKTRMVNIVYGVIIYIFMFGLLQWVVPGGVF